MTRRSNTSGALPLLLIGGGAAVLYLYHKSQSPAAAPATVTLPEFSTPVITPLFQNANVSSTAPDNSIAGQDGQVQMTPLGGTRYPL